MSNGGENYCKPIVNHISRIQGQFETLKKYLNEGRSCDQIVQLATSVLKSCGSLKAKLVEGFIVQELLADESVLKEKGNELESLVKLIKS